MPLYNYECKACGPFMSFHLMDDRNTPTSCPDCRRVARRVVSAPNLAMMNSNTRKAHAINERSRYEPRVSDSRTGHNCGTGCGCKPSKRKPARKPDGTPALHAPRQGNRPWMLGH